jgi:diguanylate cyclase (GGDEF)-like protein
MEYRIIRPDGTLRWIWSRSSPVYEPGGRFTRMVGFAEDITDRKKADEELRGIHEKLNQALEEAGRRASESEKLTELVDMIQCCRTIEQAYEIAQEALASIFDPEAGALCITSSSRSIVEVAAAWGEAPGTEKAFGPDDCWALRRGKVHQVADAVSPLRCPHVPGPLPGGYVCVPLVAQGETLGLLYLECRHTGSIRTLSRQAQTVGERLSLALANLQLREVLRHQSVRDPLTGLFNRRYMEETLTRELARAARRHDPVALVLCDLDHFKQFNDIFGHEAGDLVLREIANLLQMQVRAGDIVCRFGGEEFVMILPDATVEVARERAESVVKEVQLLALSHRGRTLGRVTISIGVSVFPEQGSTAEELLHAADQALYRAKREGRDRVILSFPGR